MKTTAIRHTAGRSAAFGAAVGLAVATATIAAGAALVAALISSDTLDESALAIAATVVTVIATLLGGLVSMAAQTQGKWITLAICCAAELGILLCAKLLAANGEPLAFGKTLLTVCASGAGAFGLTLLPKRGGGKRRYPRRYR